MAKTTATCEFMDNAFPAGQLKLSGDFYVVEDESGEHMIFSADQKGRLCLILKGPNGHNEWINLSDKFQVPEDQTISALAVSQDRNRLIHLVFAARQKDGTDKLFVVKPMCATRSEWTREFDGSSDLFMGEQWNITIREILLGTSTELEDGATLYPQTYLVFKHLDKVTEDIWAISIDKEKKSWINQKSFEMPCNADKIVAKCVGNIPLYQGLFVLYKQEISSPHAKHLKFVGLNQTMKNPVLTTIPQKLPEGASHIASFENSQGFTDLIIGGTQLTWRGSQECFLGSADPHTVLNNNFSVDASLSHMRIAQSKELLSVWSLSEDALLSYQEFDIPEDFPPTARTPNMPLMTKESGSDRFTALQNPALGQKLFVISKDGALKMLEQDCQTAMWNTPIDVMIPDSNEMIEFRSHTVQVQVVDPESGAPLPKAPLQLWCLTSAELLVNGVSARGSPSGQRVETDDSGFLTIIIKSDSLSAPLLRLTDVGSIDKFLGGPALEIDPMIKLWTTVDALTTIEDLKKMVLPDGTPFINPELSEDELEKALKALQDLSKARKHMGGSAHSMNINAKLGWVNQAADRVWGAWMWVRDHIKAGWNWVLEKVGNVWQFVVNIAGKTWTFLLENHPQVAAAMQIVFEVVSKGWNWVKKTFEFLFSWSDILEVKNIFVNLTTQGLLWGVDSITLFELKVDDYFEDLRSKARSIKNMKLPPEMLSMLATGDPEFLKQAQAERGESELDAVSSSPAASYGAYHLKHSGNPTSRTKGRTTTERLYQRLTDIVMQAQGMVTRCQENITALLKSKGISVVQLLQNLGADLIEGVIAIIQKVVVGVLGSISDLLLELTNGINTTINIPILSNLYKRMTNGSSLTILDAVCLILAIPATFVYKIVTGKKPSEISGIERLIDPNFMKQELKTRMTRVAMEAVSTGGGANPFMSFAFADGVSAPPAELSGPKPKAGLTQKQRDEISKSGMRFAQSAGLLDGLLKTVVPSASMIWYQWYSWPRQMLPSADLALGLTILSTAGKLIPWLLSFGGLLTLTAEEKADWSKIDLEYRFGDQWWNARFGIWLTSGIPIIFNMAGKEAASIAEFIVGVGLCYPLAKLQIDCWAKDGPGYSVYLATEEWVKLLAKTVSGLSGVMKGGGVPPYVAFTALGLTYSGMTLNMIRIGLENAGKRDALITGMNVD